MTVLKSFYLFSRPHTILGTTLSVLGLYVVAVAHGRPADLHGAELFWALAACLAANIYIVGLNQLTDVEIDRVNKPYLPIAADLYSIRTGVLIVLTALMLAVLIALVQGTYLLVTVVLSLLLGTAYSLPPIRLKRFHFWAAFCIFTVRGVVVNLFLFLHFHRILNGQETLPPAVWALTLFMFGFGLAIAWFKDVPDMEGDARYAIRTLSLRLGPRRVFRLGRALLAACYLGMMAAGAFGLPGVDGLALAVSHFILLAVLWRAGDRVDPAQREDMRRYYMTIWGFFFAEYVVFPITCLLA